MALSYESEFPRVSGSCLLGVAPGEWAQEGTAPPGFVTLLPSDTGQLASSLWAAVSKQKAAVSCLGFHVRAGPSKGLQAERSLRTPVVPSPPSAPPALMLKEAAVRNADVVPLLPGRGSSGCNAAVRWRLR